MLLQRKPNLEEQSLNRAVDTILNSLEGAQPGTEAYSNMLSDLDHITDIRKKEKEWSVKPETLAQIAGSLLSIVLIMNYEKSDALVTKAVSHIWKPKL